MTMMMMMWIKWERILVANSHDPIRWQILPVNRAVDPSFVYPLLLLLLSVYNIALARKICFRQISNNICKNFNINIFCQRAKRARTCLKTGQILMGRWHTKKNMWYHIFYILYIIGAGYRLWWYRHSYSERTLPQDID